MIVRHLYLHRLNDSLFFFFNDTATTEIYTLSLHDALPISFRAGGRSFSATSWRRRSSRTSGSRARRSRDRKSTRLNSSHGYISYAVFCLKKKIRMLENGQATRDDIATAMKLSCG